MITLVSVTKKPDCFTAARKHLQGIIDGIRVWEKDEDRVARAVSHMQRTQLKGAWKLYREMMRHKND